MKEICLYNLEQAGVIILENTGVVYFNQVGGSACIRAEAEGLFVPVSNDPPLDSMELNLSTRLRSLTKGAVGVSRGIAREINALLLEVSSTDTYQVNMDRLKESRESWVHISVTPQGEYSQYMGYESFEAVLTWPNSAGFTSFSMFCP